MKGPLDFDVPPIKKGYILWSAKANVQTGDLNNSDKDAKTHKIQKNASSFTLLAKSVKRCNMHIQLVIEC